MKYASLIAQLSLSEKAAFCSGKDFWHLVDLERLNIPSIMLTDGPHGLRKQSNEKTAAGDVLGNSVPSTCFPTAVTTASSWNPELLFEMGKALGEECLKEQVGVLLGPGVNMKRSPLCGRNFEYFSEEPLLAGKLGAALINGVQSMGVGTSLKHFAGNNQECRRMTIDTVADERTLREIYLTAFEIAVKEAKPWTVMNAYNRLNGTYCAENPWLLTKVLRQDWGFDGVVVTDWGATDDIVDGLNAGQNLEMPSSAGLNPQKIIEGVENGTLSEDVLDQNVDTILTLIFKAAENMHSDYKCDMKAHHELARKIAGESLVLLKNEENVLPLDKSKKIAVIGEMAKSPRYQGAGSSLINPTQVDDAYTEFLREGLRVAYARGYDKATDVPDDALISSAVALAKKADIAVVFIGLTEFYESEGFDRKHISLPPSHNVLVKAVSEVNKNTIVVLSGGSAVEMPWLADVKAVLNGLLGGQASGGAVVDILTGKVNPSGKLAETYPLSYEDTPSFRNFPGKMLSVEYRESIYIGYRYYDKTEKEVLFPFGFGLSYTSFEYSGLKIGKKKIKDTDTVTVSFKVKNTGKVAGAEVSQLYVAAPRSAIYKAPKELKGFGKVFLEPGEEKEISIELSKRSFAYYNVNIGDWHVESGDYKILVGASSRDIRLEDSITVESTVKAEVPDYTESAPAYYNGDPAEVPVEQFEAVLGHTVPNGDRDPSLPIGINSTLEMASEGARGKKINNFLSAALEKFGGGGINAEMMRCTILQLPIRGFMTMSAGVFNQEMCDALCAILSDEPLTPELLKMAKNIPAAIAKIPTLMKTL